MARWKREKVEGEPNLYHRGREFWACATPPGSRQAAWEKIGEVRIMEARRLRDDFVGRVRSGAVAARRPPKVRVADVIDGFIARCDARADAGTLAPRTADDYKSKLVGHFKPSYGSRLIASITPDDLIEWHEAQLRLDAATSTIRGRWIAIRAMLAWAVRQGYVPVSPASQLTRDEVPPTGGAEVRFLTRAEMERLLDAAPRRFRTAIATMLFTGMRASEVLGLIWEEVDRDAQVLHCRYQMSRSRQPRRVRLKRGGRPRDVMMIDQLRSLLRDHRMASPWSADTDLVFTSTVGTTMTYRRLSEAMVRACKDAGLRGVSSHKLRHTFASILIYQGRDVVFVSRQLGHSKPTTTLNVYAHLFEAARQAAEARDQLGREFGGMLG